MNADGSGLANLTNDPSSDSEPTWSPDGTKIAFSTNRGPTGDMEIFVMNADGTNPVNLTNSPANESDPDWQPVQGTPRSGPGPRAVLQGAEPRREEDRTGALAAAEGRLRRQAPSSTRARSAREVAWCARRRARACACAPGSA